MNSGNRKEPFEATGRDGRTQENKKKKCRRDPIASMHSQRSFGRFFNQTNKPTAAKSACLRGFFDQAQHTSSSSCESTGHLSSAIVCDRDVGSVSSTKGYSNNNPKRPHEGDGGDVRTPRLKINHFDSKYVVSPLANAPEPTLMTNTRPIQSMPGVTQVFEASRSFRACKGNCPKHNWRIDQYCETCHG